MTELFLDTIDSDIGQILSICNRNSLCALDFADCKARILERLQQRYGPIQLTPATDPLGVSTCIRAYLNGDCHSLDDIAVSPGGTVFQRQVWAALRKIPPGSTTSYGKLAAKVGRPTAYRAVGMANARNPIAIVIPCHRVIGAKGTLTGYAGGLKRKQWLLLHEGFQGVKDFKG